MLSALTALATKKVAVYAGMGVAGCVTAFILKKIPNNTIKAKFGSWMYNLGVVCTLGMGKWKWTKNVWNKTIEPYFVDAIDNILVTGISKFVDGLRSDNA